MQPPSNTHDALRHIDNLLADIMRVTDAYTTPLPEIPEPLRNVCAAAADARLLAVWVRDQLKGEKQ